MKHCCLAPQVFPIGLYGRDPSDLAGASARSVTGEGLFKNHIYMRVSTLFM